MISIIAAIGENLVIGKDDSLLWNLPEDLKRFKELTSYKIIIMGRKTFESLPGILPNRYHIVITRDVDYKVENNSVKVVNSIGQLIPYIEDEFENFVIGGGEIYKELIPYASKLYITRVHKEYIGDTYFPRYESSKWEIVKSERGIVDKDNTVPYEFLELVIKSGNKVKKKKFKI
ncbi:MAG: dihydrofolate reductase [Clostridium sp.]